MQNVMACVFSGIQVGLSGIAMRGSDANTRCELEALHDRGVPVRHPEPRSTPLNLEPRRLAVGAPGLRIDGESRIELRRGLSNWTWPAVRLVR